MNVPNKTPNPLHVPPAGVGFNCALRFIAGAFLHTPKSFPAFGMVGGITVMVTISFPEHPLPFEKLYVSVCAPRPAVDGLKLPPELTPVPLHVPPFGIPVNCTGIF